MNPLAFLTNLIPGFSWLKAGITLAGVAALAVLVWLPFHWKGQRDDLQAWQAKVVQGVTLATVPLDAKGRRKLLEPDDVPTAINALADDRDDARRNLEIMSNEAEAAKQRSDASDVELARTQAANNAKQSASAKEIERLRAAKGTGDEAADAALIATDSESAWRGWQ